jgi:iron complex outermembrane receptor protein
MPWGNSTLLPETATGGETSWSFSSATAQGLRTTLDLTLHASKVDNLIQWLPGETGLWSAENVRSVNVTGAEARAGTELTVSEWKIKGYVNYGLTRSAIAVSDIPNDRSEGSQLVYSPLHHLNVNIDAGWRILSGGITAVAESRRYTTSDNSEWLPATFLADMYLGTSIKAGMTVVRADLRISNILNTGSESVRNYPMPLRAFNLRLTLTLSDKPVIHETNP